jgi:hypothetical protein
MKAPPDDEKTGLAGLRTWSRVYWGVLVVLAAWIAILTALTRAFS